MDLQLTLVDIALVNLFGDVYALLPPNQKRLVLLDCADAVESEGISPSEYHRRISCIRLRGPAVAPNNLTSYVRVLEAQAKRND